MQSWIDSYLSVYRVPFYFCQVLVILFLTLTGFALVNIFAGKKDKNIKDCIMYLSLSFPTGVALFIIVGYTALVVGIPYNSLVIGVIMFIIAGVFCGVSLKYKVFNGYKISLGAKLTIGVLLILAVLVSVSGVISISVSNDSLYYFWQYPRAICYYGGLRDQFDNFMTDTGLGAAVIGTLPFLFGFGETFGIQEFFHISFVIFFGLAVSNCLSDRKNVDGRKVYVISIIAAMLMATATSSYILAHWAMSNMFFMEYFFIGMYLVYGLKRGEEFSQSFIVIFSLILFACSSIRMEGGIFILLLILTACILPFEKRELVILTLPIVILQTAFEGKIFITYVIDNPFIFLTKGKALLQLAAYVCLLIYILFIRNRITKKINSVIPLVVVAGLVIVNAGLCLMDSVIYLSNLRAFFGNLTGQSGWGILPYISCGALAVIILLEILLAKDGKKGPSLLDIEHSPTAYWLYCSICFLLITLAVAFARGDALNVNTGDSGNRVLLQITPFILMGIVVWMVELLSLSDKTSK